ncbi:MAG: aminodeoxychorismate synthase component I [Candidatus Omnitrophica bacterium]|nr:aminodeoxychorismate synthase component I [Candidatus Omnitrophota bacterium]
MTETIKCAKPTEKIFQNFSEMTDTSLLNSSLTQDAARFSFMGMEPFLVIKGKGTKLTLKTKNGTFSLKQNPFDFLKKIFDNVRVKNPTSFPFSSGGIGYFAYDLKNILEDLPTFSKDDLLLPDIYFVFYRCILARDNSHPDKVHINVLDIDSPGHLKTKEIISMVKDGLRRIRLRDKKIYTKKPVHALTSNFSRTGYIKAVKHVIDYIHAGDIYQACLSQRFKTKCYLPPYELYLKLNRLSPSPFSAYLNFENCKVISSSPELFLRLRENILETRPMKGTRPRGKNNAEDLALKKDLMKSPKDAAELAMIVDLERNDLGKVSVPGTVKVVERKKLETYPTVFQTVSVIKSRISSATGPIDIVKAAFPGGSITGCPKIRAMEIIDELEPTCRSVYTGATGYISFHGTMDLNVAIRTMIMKKNNVYFQTGGGIVADSDPAKEYEETLHKARAMMEALGA